MHRKLFEMALNVIIMNLLVVTSAFIIEPSNSILYHIAGIVELIIAAEKNKKNYSLNENNNYTLKFGKFEFSIFELFYMFSPPSQHLFSVLLNLTMPTVLS